MYCHVFIQLILKLVSQILDKLHCSEQMGQQARIFSLGSRILLVETSPFILFNNCF